MVQGYLMDVKGFFLNRDDSGRNYQIYVPDKKTLLGYFTSKELDVFVDIFCESDLDEGKIEKLNSKIKKGKFVREINVNGNLLEEIISSADELSKAKRNFRTSFSLFRAPYLELSE